MPNRGMSDGPAFERLRTAECWRLLADCSFGRICFCIDERVEILPSAYTLRPGLVYFRAAAFGPVARQVHSRPVTMQVDDLAADRPATWSVTVTGPSHRVESAATLADLWSPVRPHLWVVGAEPMWIALAAEDVRGQRVRP